MRGHVQMDNRHGLVVNTRLTQASGKAEPMAAFGDGSRDITGQGRVTLGADKGYDQKEFGARLARASSHPRTLRKKVNRRDRPDAATRHPGLPCSAKWRRKRVEEIFRLAQDRRRTAQDSSIVESPELVGPSPSRAAAYKLGENA